MDSQSFPCDMWEFMFGEVRGREDTDGDGYCEDGIDANGDGEIDAVLDFIRGQLQATELTCAEANAQLNENSSGAYWIRSAVGARDTACAMPAVRIGRPNNPVMLMEALIPRTACRSLAWYLGPMTGRWTFHWSEIRTMLRVAIGKRAVARPRSMVRSFWKAAVESTATSM